MEWIWSFVLSAAVFVYGLCKAIVLMSAKNKGKRFLNPVNTLVICTFVSSVILFFPIYNVIFASDPIWYFKVFLLSVHNAIRLFIVDGEFTIVLEHLVYCEPWVGNLYSALAAILFVAAPVLTVGGVLSFFKNIAANRRYLFGFFKNVYVFSELNDKSLALAESIKKNHKSSLLIFTDVFEKNEEASYEGIEKAREIGAICFKKDIQTINFRFHSKQSEITFFAIGEDESENIDQALKLISEYKNREKTNLYLFSSRTDSEMLLTSSDKGRMKVRRVNDVRSLINRILYEDGERIFGTARESGDGDKRISAVVVGLGQHGANMVKALSWLCQMDGYQITIDAFDQDEMAEEKFTAQCPELMSPKFNGTAVEGEARYTIRIHSHVNVETCTFTDRIQSLHDATYVLVALGSDELNIRTAVCLRMLFERIGCHPFIQAIVYNSEKKAALEGIQNYRGQPYDIDFIGDLKTSYSEDVIIGSELETEALNRHLHWGNEEEFWNFEYNYRSSVASAIHRKMKLFCKMPGIDKVPEERSEQELWALRRLEHRRWNAYMRSEGYCYAAQRNDLAKTHHCLVPFDELSEKDKKKDDD